MSEIEPNNVFDMSVYRAAGMVSVQLGIGIDEALLKLRHRAFVASRSLPDIARDVIEQNLRFDHVSTERIRITRPLT